MKPSIRTFHCYGDSLTAGYGAAPSAGWIASLSRAYPSFSFYNHGECGLGLADIIDNAWNIARHPAHEEALFLMGGTNDIFAGIRKERLHRLAEEGITALSRQMPLCIGIPNLPTPSSIAAGWLSEWNFQSCIDDLRAYAVFLRRLAARLSLPTADFQASLPYDDRFYADGTHPNGNGYKIFMETAAKAWRLAGMEGPA